jgi:DNA-binding HxlR family transcriptional regulator
VHLEDGDEMTAKRRYRLLCPIARALDVVGDRWALLIIRDLHVGPARFHDLETGLGIATNLLSTRLTELTEAGLIEKTTDASRAVYQLTELGRSTDRLLWELARFGREIDPDSDPREPGNLRTIALPLRLILEANPTAPTSWPAPITRDSSTLVKAGSRSTSTSPETSKSSKAPPTQAPSSPS